MDEHKIKFEFKTLAVTLALAIIFTGLNSIGIIRAENGTPPPPPADGAPQEQQDSKYAEANCQQAMVNFGEYEFGRFKEFLKNNFQNKSSTTSLLDAAIGRYRELRMTLYNKYYEYYPLQGAPQLTEGLSFGACNSSMNDILDRARHELETRAVQTSTVKKTTALIEKYKQINSELGALNRTFVMMKSYLDVFASKLPCYIAKSCQKG
jgi:hypothetical protein